MLNFDRWGRVSTLMSLEVWGLSAFLHDMAPPLSLDSDEPETDLKVQIPLMAARREGLAAAAWSAGWSVFGQHLPHESKHRLYQTSNKYVEPASLFAACPPLQTCLYHFLSVNLITVLVLFCCVFMPQTLNTLRLQVSMFRFENIQSLWRQ